MTAHNYMDKSLPINGGPPSVLVIHQQLSDADLLVVRISAKNGVLAPLVIFQDTQWESEQFCDIIQKEPARMPKQVEVDFWDEKEVPSVLSKCFGPDGYCVKDDIQACVILPLASELDTTLAVHGESSLLRLLGLESLLTEAEKENNKWCLCKDPDWVDNMILCDSTRCKYGWYHMKCCEVPENHEIWYCDACKLVPEEDRAKTSYDNDSQFDDDIYEASDMRIQRVRTVSQVWTGHPWPKDPEKVHKSLQKIKWEDKIPFKNLMNGRYDKTLRCRLIVKQS
jgi:hypothetical protein